MKQVITAKLTLHPSPEQFRALRQTQLAYRDALNYTSRYAFAHGKMSNQQRLQKETYADVRTQYQLPSQMACNVPRQVGATYKTLWTRVKQNAAQRKAGITKKRYKGLDQAPTYGSPTLIYNFHRDYSFKPEQHVSVLTLEGRVILSYSGYTKHVRLIEHGAHIGAAKLWYDKPHKQFSLLVSLEVEVADPRWAFAELQSVIAYKATLAGSMTVEVDAHFTSQACPKCGYVSKANRPHAGLLFVCQNCHFSLHADLVGARNITMRTLVIRQDWMTTGILSECPDGSDVEAKAARLQKYAELRWSPDPSPLL